MRLRLILLVLSLLSFLSVSIGGFLYYVSLRKTAFEEAERQAVIRTVMIKKNLSSFLSENIKPVKALAGIEKIRQALLSPNPETLANANAMLDHFQTALDADVCYLTDAKGNTIASSNRYAADSFVGESFMFRPYVEKALQGKTATYLAVGTTSKKRGVYNSHPVYKSGQNTPAGVAVIKASVGRIEKEITISDDDEIVLVTNPRGVVFISSRKDWLYHTLWQISSEEILQIAESQQFGKGPWDWIGFEIKDKTHAVDSSGNEYLMYQSEINNYPGWNIIYLQKFKTIFKRVSAPLIQISGHIILSLCLLVGLAVAFLYQNASKEIIRRAAAEKALRESEERYRFIYHNAPAMLHSVDNQGVLVSVSDHWLEALGYQRDEVIGQKLIRFLTQDSGKYVEDIVIPDFFKTGLCKDIPYQFVKKNNETIDVLLSATGERDETGNVVRSLAVSIDITERKKAEKALELAKEELSRYSRELECQVRERTREITSILKYTPDVVYIKDTKERYLLINSRYEELFNIKNEDVRGKTAHEFMPKELADQFQISDRQVLLEKRPCQAEHHIPQSDDIHTYLTVKFPIYDESENISGVGGISTDITELKKAQEQLRRLSGSVITSQEKERSAIARELHDELGQILTALRMDAVWILKHLKDKDAKAAERAFGMCSLIDKSIEDVRSIAIRLRPGVLDDLGLVDALEWFTADFERRTEITCIFEHFNVPVLKDTVATAAYRIAQEALTNVARHAHATHADVILKAENNMLTLTVTDDGRGFDTSGLNEGEGLGVAGMRERAGLAGGSLDVQSLPGEGTRVCFEISVKC